MRIIGFLVCGPKEADRWLKQVLDQRKEQVDDMIICTNNADQKTKDLIKTYDFWQYEDNREWGKEQPNIKNDLIAKASKLKADWFLPSDADEVFDKIVTRDALEELANKEAVAWNFAIFNLWGDPDHYRHDLSFWNIRFWQNRPELGTTLIRKNVHCGLAPPSFYKYGHHAPYILDHYGLMLPADRERKIDRYKKYDPNAKFKGREYYDKLKNEKTVRPYNREDMRKRVREDVINNFKYEYRKKP